MNARVPLEADAPGFAEPWQAEAYAVAHALAAHGLYTWSEWTSTFSAEIAARPQQADEGVEAAYFRQWLAALEQLLVARGVCTADDIARLATRWRLAYLNTPHGQAVELAHAEVPCASTPHPVERGAPVAVSPARTS